MVVIRAGLRFTKYLDFQESLEGFQKETESIYCEGGCKNCFLCQQKHKRQASKPLPMPLFNFRKRQRQALVSDPQFMSAQSSSFDAIEKLNNNNNDYDDESLMGLMSENYTVDEKSDFESKSEFRQINRPWKSQHAMTNNSGNYGFHTSLPDSSPSKFKSQSFQGSSNDSFGSTNKLFFKGNNVNSFHPQEHQNAIPPLSKSGRGKGYTVNCRGRGRYESGSWNVGYHSNNSTVSSSATTPRVEVSYRGSGNLQQDKKTYPRTTTNYQGDRNINMNRMDPSLGGQLRVQSGTFQSRFGAQNTSQNAKGKAYIDTKYSKGQSSTVSYTPSRCHDMSTANKGASIFDTEDVKYSKTTFPKPKSSPFPNKKPDISLRLFTCPISLLRAWCGAQPFDGPIMFEVYGKVISATTSDKTGTGKEFVLQDDSSSIKCTFYEIDRELPTLMRGQIYRVVGTFAKKRGTMKVISVRLASREERQVYEVDSEKTMEEMQNLGFLMNEP